MTINLNLGCGDYIPHRQIITLPQNEINVVINSELYACETVIVEIQNVQNTVKKRVKIGEPFNITDFFKIAGETTMMIMLEINGQRAKQWTVEPFIIQELPTGNVAFPEIEALKKDIKILKQAIKEIINK